MRILLYISSEIGTYAGDDSPLPGATDRISGGVAAVGRAARRPDDPAAPRTQAARAPGGSAARVDVSCDADDWHLGRAFLAPVRRFARRQFVGRPARPGPVADLCRLAAAGVATQGHAAPPRRVLARLAAGRARWHAIQPHQHAADHRDDRQSADAAGAGGVRQDVDGGPAGGGVAQSAGRGDRPPRGIGVGLGAAPAGAPPAARGAARRSVVWGRRLRGPRAGRVRARGQSLSAARLPRDEAPPDHTPAGWHATRPGRAARAPAADAHRRMARGPRDSRASRPAGGPRPRGAVVDQFGGSDHGARARARAALYPALGTRAVFPRAETGRAQE